MKIKINNQGYEAKLGETILDICRRENIFIPTLCAHGKLRREAACRLCLVEVNKTDKLVTSCTFQVCEGLEVLTESERINKAREINLELLWADHAGKCATCKKNRRCELQNLAEIKKIENFHFIPRKGEMTTREEQELIKDNWSRVVVDEENAAISRTTEFCVECRRCINICPIKSYGFNNRAGDVVVGTPYNESLDCLFCGACVKHCPTAAITDKNDFEAIISDLKNLKKMAIVIVDPAVIKSVQWEFPQLDSFLKLNGLLRKIGFERIFSLSWGMEKYLEKLANEVAPKNNLFRKTGQTQKRVKINSNCPAYKRLVEKYYPSLKDNLVRVPFPDNLLAEKLKTDYAQQEKINPEDIKVFVISSCVAKKVEKNNHIDYVLTVRELGRLARKMNIDGSNVKEENYDCIGDDDDQLAVEKMIEAGGTVELLERKLGRKGEGRFLAVNNFEEAKKILKNLVKQESEYDFIELMMCPGGCIHGGGQAIETKTLN